MNKVFDTLNRVDVSKYIENKNGLSYLSWAKAWEALKVNFPTATYHVYENRDEFNYFHDHRTAWVKVGVTVEGLEHIEMLPVMDFRNKSILLENVTSFEVNKAIQRALTKAIARHGLGLYIYMGEDLPNPQDGVTTTVGGYKTASKATPEEAKQYWSEFVELCNRQDVKAQEFLEEQCDLSDRSKAHNTVVQWLREPALLEQQLINYKESK